MEYRSKIFPNYLALMLAALRIGVQRDLAHSYTFTFDEFRGGIVVIEARSNIAGFVNGRSPAAIIFGMGLPPSRVPTELDRFFRHGDRAVFEALFLKAAPSSDFSNP